MRVIEFLNFNYIKLKAGIARYKAKQEAAAGINIPPPDEDKIENYISGEQFDLSGSIFLQQVMGKMYEQSDESLEHKIKEWYLQTKEYETNTSTPRDLNTSLIKFLGSTQYDESAAKKFDKEVERKLKAELDGWIESKEFLAEYQKFLKKESKNVIAAMLEHIDAVGNPGLQGDLHVQIPPFYVSEDRLDEVKKKYVAPSNNASMDDLQKNLRLKRNR